MATTTTVSSTLRTKWELGVQPIAEGKMQVAKYLDKGAYEKGYNQAHINRFKRLDKQTTAGTLGTLKVATDALPIYTQKQTLTPVLYQAHFYIDDGASIESYLSDAQFKDLIANQQARSHDYMLLRTLGTQGFRHLIDKDATYQLHGTATSGTTGNLTDTGATFSNFIGGYYGVYNPEGANYDNPWKKITSLTSTTGLNNTTTWEQAIDTTSKYRAVATDNIAAGDKLTTSGLWDVQTLHRKLETEHFDSGAPFKGFFDPAQYNDLWTDSDFRNSAIYDDSNRLKGYQVPRWADIDLVMVSQVYREDIDGTENTDGAVYCSPIIGKHCAGVVRWGHGSGDFGIEWIYVNDADSGNLTKNKKFISWKTFHAEAVTRSTSCIVLCTGATDIGIF